MSRPSSLVDQRGMNPPSAKARIVASNAGLDYGALRVFQNVNLEVGEREVVAIIGPSGCGKSTLLRLVADLVDVLALDIGVHLVGRQVPQQPPLGARLVHVPLPGLRPVPVLVVLVQQLDVLAQQGAEAAGMTAVLIRVPHDEWEHEGTIDWQGPRIAALSEVLGLV